MKSGDPGAGIRLWRWALRGRHRFTDWLLAVGSYPLVAVLTVASLLPNSEREFPLPLLLRLLPRLLGPELIDTISDALSLVVGVAALVIVPGVTTWAILHRRSQPQRLLTIGVVVTLLFMNPLPMALGLYSHAAWFTDRKQLGVWSLAGTAAIVIVMLPSSIVVIVAPLVIITPLTAGLWVGVRRQLVANRQQLIANLRERSEHLEREQHLLAERAATAERNRIAREMHDVVAHRVSLMVLHAGGLEVSATQPSTIESAAVIRAIGREALSELRELLGVLRDDREEGAPTVPQPVLADLDRLVEGWRAAGMTVRMEVTGARRPLPSRLERTAYRVVQEALTNAGKHATGDPVSIHLGYGERELEITVTNHPPSTTEGGNASTATTRPPEGALPVPTATDQELENPKGNNSVAGPLPGGGYGLSGLRERLALAGGGLTAGPHQDRGWRVHAIVPVEASTRQEPDNDER